MCWVVTFLRDKLLALFVTLEFLLLKKVPSVILFVDVYIPLVNSGMSSCRNYEVLAREIFIEQNIIYLY